AAGRGRWMRRRRDRVFVGVAAAGGPMLTQPSQAAAIPGGLAPPFLAAGAAGGLMLTPPSLVVRGGPMLTRRSRLSADRGGRMRQTRGRR
ncbi:MAG TPA: hypothetical protein VIV12_26810, partial [Streptosporangiaceae bacterium]